MGPDLFMVFDVESVGLHGEGFAAGWVVIDRSGKELDCGRFACNDGLADGSDEGRAWLRVNLPGFELLADDVRDVRSTFWREWARWRAKGAVLAADCPWPVEARFLAACVDDDPARRDEGPYPLIDVASVRLAAGLDPLAVEPRRPDELPFHDPLADARQSARLLTLAFRAVELP